MVDGKLRAGSGEIEDVDRFLPFRIDQRDFDITSETRERRTDIVEQSRPVLRDYFQQRAVLGRAVVETRARFHCRRSSTRRFDPCY